MQPATSAVARGKMLSNSSARMLSRVRCSNGRTRADKALAGDDIALWNGYTAFIHQISTEQHIHTRKCEKRKYIYIFIKYIKKFGTSPESWSTMLIRQAIDYKCGKMNLRKIPQWTLLTFGLNSFQPILVLVH